MYYEISYGDEKYARAQYYHALIAKKIGKFDKVITYTPQTLDEKFKTEQEALLREKRGAGFWIWKSHIINVTLEQMQMGDYLFYSDSGAIIRHSIRKFVKLMKKNHDDIMVFENYGLIEKYWTKRDVFRYFDYEDESCLNSNQIMGGFIVIRKTPETVRIFREYEEACVYRRLSTDDDNEMGFPNFEGFRTNRHDQSILSVLLKKNGIRPYRDPSQFGMFQHPLYVQKRMNCNAEYETFKRSKFPLFMIYLHRTYYCVPEGDKLYKWWIRESVKIWKEYMRYWKDKNKAFID